MEAENKTKLNINEVMIILGTLNDENIESFQNKYDKTQKDSIITQCLSVNLRNTKIASLKAINNNKNEKIINKVIELLTVDNWSIRNEAALTLSRIYKDMLYKQDFHNLDYFIASNNWIKIKESGTKSIDKLLKIIRNTNENIFFRTKAIELLVEIGENRKEEISAVFLELLAEKNFQINLSTIEAIGKLKLEKFQKNLINIVKDENNQKSNKILIDRAEKEDRYYREKKENEIIEKNNALTWRVRLEAINVLFKLNQKDAVLLLNELQDDYDIRIRKKSISILREINDENFNYLNIDDLVNQLLTSYDIRKELMYLLASFGIKVLENLLNLLEKDIDENDSRNIYTLKKTLVLMGNQIVNPIISKFTEMKNNKLKSILIEVLNELDTELPLEPFLKLLETDDLGILKNTVIVIGNIGNIKTVQPLIELLNSKKLDSLSFENLVGRAKFDYLETQRSIFRNLGNFRDKEATETLCNFLKIKEDYDDKIIILEALGKIADIRVVDVIRNQLLSKDVIDKKYKSTKYNLKMLETLFDFETEETYKIIIDFACLYKLREFDNSRSYVKIILKTFEKIANFSTEYIGKYFDSKEKFFENIDKDLVKILVNYKDETTYNILTKLLENHKKYDYSIQNIVFNYLEYFNDEKTNKLLLKNIYNPICSKILTKRKIDNELITSILEKEANLNETKRKGLLNLLLLNSPEEHHIRPIVPYLNSNLLYPSDRYEDLKNISKLLLKIIYKDKKDLEFKNSKEVIINLENIEERIKNEINKKIKKLSKKQLEDMKKAIKDINMSYFSMLSHGKHIESYKFLIDIYDKLTLKYKYTRNYIELDYIKEFSNELFIKTKTKRKYSLSSYEFNKIRKFLKENKRK